MAGYPGFSSRLGYWKAEEYINFAFPASEVIFDGLLGPIDYHIWQVIVRMTELVFRQRELWDPRTILYLVEWQNDLSFFLKKSMA